jgi:hypothetical protein
MRTTAVIHGLNKKSKYGKDKHFETKQNISNVYFIICSIAGNIL